ncbi:galactose mutarotase [bacterium]|nr:galactose mutarotase [bacterium]
MHINHVPPIAMTTPIQQTVASHYMRGDNLKADCFCKSADCEHSDDVKIIKKSFGVTKAGEKAELFTLVNKNGGEVSISSFGATIVDIKVPDKNGKRVQVLQGYNSVKDYDGTPNGHAGGTIGPCANKIGEGKFTLNGKEYQLETNKDGGKTHCHGASAGFDMKNWKSEVVKNGVKFTLERPDGEGGYPGNLKATVTYTFDDDNKLRVDYRAESDKDTVLNLTNHAYFNLDGAEHTQENSVYNHVVELPNSSKYTVNGQYSLPTGEIAEVKGTPMDFTTPKRLGDVIDADFDQIKLGSGFDQNYCVDGYNGKDLIEVAKVTSPETGIQLKVSSNLPGFQFYSANHLGKKTQTAGRDGRIYEKRSSFCVEPQFYPDAMAKFPEKPILKQGEEYNRTIVYEFDVED